MHKIFSYSFRFSTTIDLCAVTALTLLAARMNWQRVKTLNDFIVFLRNII